MDFKSQALRLNQLLTRTKDMWQDEVLDSYPESLEKYNLEWMEQLGNLPIKDWHAFDGHQTVDALKSSNLATFLQEIIESTKLETAEIIPPKTLEDWAFTDVKFKKKHEINRMAPLLKIISSDHKITHMIDIGGGVGHLSRTLSHYYGINTICIDREIQFQNNGKKRLSKYRQLPDAGKMEFSNLNFGCAADDEQLKKHLTKKSFTIGLHTCGPLANVIINSSINYQNAGLFNFGCCYHLLNNEIDFPKSNFYKQNFSLKLNLYARTLASRAHCAISIEEFNTKYRVKNYRQGLHLFLYHKLKIKDCFNVGEMHIREYSISFGEYVTKKLMKMNVPHTYSEDEINKFYDDEMTQSILKKMFIASMIRWQLGRPLEVYILLDRAIYLEEAKFKVSMKEYFTETISPRNIGILAFTL